MADWDDEDVAEAAAQKEKVKQEAEAAVIEAEKQKLAEKNAPKKPAEPKAVGASSETPSDKPANPESSTTKEPTTDPKKKE